jgi:hypothetical protein
LLRELKFIFSPLSDLTEVLENLRLRQRKILQFPEDYSTNRSDLVDFILEQGERFKLKPLTIHISIHIMDYSHYSSLIPRPLFKPIAAVCILISCKSEESENIPKIENFTENPASFKSLELEILSLLNWRLHVTTPLHFIEFYSSLGFIFEEEVEDIRCVKIARKFAVFLCELCITQTRFARVFPEELALCCLAGGRKKLGINQVWPSELLKISRTSPDPQLLDEMLGFYQLNFPGSLESS